MPHGLAESEAEELQAAEAKGGNRLIPMSEAKEQV
jgi:hypothetical protein